MIVRKLSVIEEVLLFILFICQMLWLLFKNAVSLPPFFFVVLQIYNFCTFSVWVCANEPNVLLLIFTLFSAVFLLGC